MTVSQIRCLGLQDGARSLENEKGNSTIKISILEDDKNYLFELKDKRKFDNKIFSMLNKEHYIKKISV